MSEHHDRYEAELLDTLGRIEKRLDLFFLRARHYPPSTDQPSIDGPATPWPTDPNAPKELRR